MLFSVKLEKDDIVCNVVGNSIFIDKDWPNGPAVILSREAAEELISDLAGILAVQPPNDTHAFYRVQVQSARTFVRNVNARAERNSERLPEWKDPFPYHTAMTQELAEWEKALV